ncbi:MAG TPA: hypothetical protein VGO47_02545, partial [Chlamydiales bacterium]|nr:hypothetical protein [Chlamydiales bacterium]
MADYSRFFALLKKVNGTGANVDRHELIRGFTYGRTDSIGLLVGDEYNRLCNQLESMLPPPPKDKWDNARKAIIAQFRSI